jgi:hypothetical protein
VTNSVFFCFAPCVPFCRVVYSVNASANLHTTHYGYCLTFSLWLSKSFQAVSGERVSWDTHLGLLSQ